MSVATEERDNGLSIRKFGLLQGLPHDLLRNELIHLLHAWDYGIWANVAAT